MSMTQPIMGGRRDKKKEGLEQKQNFFKKKKKYMWKWHRCLNMY